MGVTEYAVRGLVVERSDWTSDQGQQKSLLVFTYQRLNKAWCAYRSVQYQVSYENHISLETGF
jgi:hypothetical protein